MNKIGLTSSPEKMHFISSKKAIDILKVVSEGDHMNIILTFLILFSFQCSATENLDYWNGEDYYRNSLSQQDAAISLIKQVEFQGSETVLDVGCGDGKITAFIAEKFPNSTVHGIDISRSMIDFAQKTFPNESYPNLTFGLQDAQDLNENELYDLIFSFTTIQWVKDHQAFLKGAYASLKPRGKLAVTMPIGFPPALRQAIDETIAQPEWAPYFNQFDDGYNFSDGETFHALLIKEQFNPLKVAIVPQQDRFPSKDVFEKFISQWFPYLRPLPEIHKNPFLKQILDRYRELEYPTPNGEVHFNIQKLEVIAEKPELK